MFFSSFFSMFLFTLPVSSDLQLLHGLLHELISGFRPQLELLKRFRPRIQEKTLGIPGNFVSSRCREKVGPPSMRVHIPNLSSSLPKRNPSDCTLD